MLQFLRGLSQAYAERRAAASIRVIDAQTLLDGRPPALLSSRYERQQKVSRLKRNKKLRELRDSLSDPLEVSGRSFLLKDKSAPQSVTRSEPQGARELCQASLKCELKEGRQSLKCQDLLRQAVAAVDSHTTFADCVFVLKTVVDFSRAKGKYPQGLDEATIRYLADILSERHSSSEESHLPRNLSLAASALAKSQVWVQSFGKSIQQLFAGEQGSLRAFNPTDIAQLCRFMAVFRSFVNASLGSVWTRAHWQLQNHEQQGHRLETTGLVSLMRSLSLCKRRGGSERSGDGFLQPELMTFAKWLQARLIDELGTCTPRQLASALLDMGALNLLEGADGTNSVLHLQREVTRAAASEQMRARDLVSILAGYSKLPTAAFSLLERQLLMTPLLPQMISLMPSCSLQDMCELLHGLASAHIGNRALLEVWSSTFILKARDAAPVKILKAC
eukprot:Skav217845  [mRNA]  locus=scaffold3024:73517:74857:+ [translate_table: standard]